MEEENVSPQIKEAFNAGYTLQQHQPELLDKILKSNDQKSEYMQAMAKGQQQYQRERIIEQQQRIKEKQQQQTKTRKR